MAFTNSRLAAPPLPTPKNWEEMEHAWSALQTYNNGLNEAYQTLLAQIGQLQTQTALSSASGSVPYAGTRFDGEGSSVWTVDASDIAYFRWTRIGALMLIQFRITGSAITTDTAASLYIYLPEVLPPSLGAPTALDYQQGGFFTWSTVSPTRNGIGLITTSRDGTNPRTVLQLDRMTTRADETSDDAATSGETDWFDTWPISATVGVAGSVFFLVDI